MELTRSDYAYGLRVLAQLEDESSDTGTLGRNAIGALVKWIGCDFSTISICNLRSGHRRVVGPSAMAFSSQQLAAFDRHFFEHPLVRAHGLDRCAHVRRISDLIERRAFRSSALFDEVYRAIGIQHVVAVPMHQDDDTLVSLVMNRSRRDFDARDAARLEMMRPHLAFLYRHTAGRARARSASQEEGLIGASLLATRMPIASRAGPQPVLTEREREVLGWLARGKSNGDIATLLGVSLRTVHKHLEHIYPKLGVETRTAAVMRALEQRLIAVRWPVAYKGFFSQ